MYIFAFLPYILQLLLVIHIVRNGKPFLWLWLIIFVPYIGGVAYIILEIIPELSRSSLKDSLAEALHPGNKVTELEDLLKHQDTVTNRTLLADAYVADGRYEEALALYDACLTGLYSEDRDIQCKRIGALYEAGKTEEAKEAMTRFKNEGQLSSADQVLLDLKINDDYDTMKDIFFKTTNFELGYLCAAHFHEEGRQDEVRAIVTEMEDNLRQYRYLKKNSGNAWYKKTKRLLES